MAPNNLSSSSSCLLIRYPSEAEGFSLQITPTLGPDEPLLKESVSQPDNRAGSNVPSPSPASSSQGDRALSLIDHAGDIRNCGCDQWCHQWGMEGKKHEGLGILLGSGAGQAQG